MAHIITGKDQIFGKWAASRIERIGTVERFGPFVALGVATGNTATDRLMAVAVFHDDQPQYGHCQISMAAADPRWASKQTIKALLSVPFIQWQYQKVWVAVPHTSERVLRFVKAIGFLPEATLKDHFGRGTHAVIARLSYGHYERIYWRKPEQAKAA